MRSRFKSAKLRPSPSSSDGRLAYVAVSGEDKIVVIDLSDLEIEDSIMPGEGSFPF